MNPITLQVGVICFLYMFLGLRIIFHTISFLHSSLSVFFYGIDLGAIIDAIFSLHCIYILGTFMCITLRVSGYVPGCTFLGTEFHVPLSYGTKCGRGSTFSTLTVTRLSQVLIIILLRLQVMGFPQVRTQGTCLFKLDYLTHFFTCQTFHNATSFLNIAFILSLGNKNLHF